MTCPNCGAELEDGSLECYVCGYEFEYEEADESDYEAESSEGIECAYCGSLIEAGSAICPVCQSELETEEAAAAINEAAQPVTTGEAAQPVTTGEAAAVKPSKAPVIVIASILAAAAIGIGIYAFVSQNKEADNIVQDSGVSSEAATTGGSEPAESVQTEAGAVTTATAETTSAASETVSETASTTAEPVTTAEAVTTAMPAATEKTTSQATVTKATTAKATEATAAEPAVTSYASLSGVYTYDANDNVHFDTLKIYIDQSNHYWLLWNMSFGGYNDEHFPTKFESVEYEGTMNSNVIQFSTQSLGWNREVDATIVLSEHGTATVSGFGNGCLLSKSEELTERP